MKVIPRAFRCHFVYDFSAVAPRRMVEVADRKSLVPTRFKYALSRAQSSTLFKWRLYKQLWLPRKFECINLREIHFMAINKAQR